MARFGDFDQYLDNAGDPLVSGKIYFYESGTTTLKNTYSDINNSIPNTNPVILTAAGRQPNVFFDGVAKAILATSADVQIAVRDPVGETSSAFGDQWVATKTYSSTDVVLGSDGVFYRSLTNGNQNNNPVSSSGFWTLLYSVEWNAGITYASGAMVTYNDLQYQSLQGTNLNQNPATATTYWVPLNFAWLATSTYALDQNVVGTDGILYTSLQATNLNHVPASSAAWWVGTSAAAAASATAAAGSATAAAADAVDTAADLVQTNQDTIDTAADLVATNQDSIDTAADLVATNQDTIDTAADAVATGNDKTATNADVVLTNADAAATALDKIATNADVVSTTADAAQVALDLIATNQDTIDTAADLVATNQDTIDTAADVVATDADMTQTGLDVTASAGSATAASGSASAAASSASAAAATYDDFDDRYLGDKSSDPTVDNDGNALLTGALYFNTVSNAMKVYTGSSWGAVAPTATSINLTSQVTGTLPVANGGTGATSLTSNNVILGNGTGAVQAVAPSTSGNVLTSNGSTWQSTTPAGGGPVLEATASGALANGDMVVVNADGTVSVVETTGYPSAAASPVIYESANSAFNSATFDSNSNKVVISYADGGNSGYGTSIVGTVSGTSITFGTPVVFNSADTDDISSTFDSVENKVVIAYQDNGNSLYGTAIVGTVSGTSITFGTAVVFESASTTLTSTVFDSASNKVVISYQDTGNASYGTAIVGTVSGTSISFGTAAVFNSASTGPMTSAFDSNSNKVVITYQDVGGSYYGAAIVGTVSGTSISFGTEVVFNSATTYYTAATFDSNSNKIVISYRDQGNSGYGTAIVGTVSGTSISFGTSATFNSSVVNYNKSLFASNSNKIVIVYSDEGNSGYGTVVNGVVSGTSITFEAPIVFESANTASISQAFDSSAGQVAIAYMDIGNSYYGTSVVFTSGTEATNLTAENYIGIADGAYADTVTATIQIVGSVDDAQTGLTAGQAYYVQQDGTLSTAPDLISVFAGTAVAATKLIVKG